MRYFHSVLNLFLAACFPPKAYDRLRYVSTVSTTYGVKWTRDRISNRAWRSRATLHIENMQNQQENDAGGAAEAPGFANVEGFVDGDDVEEEQDARAQDAQPIEVEIPNTYHWGVVAAQLEAWQYKSSEKTAQGTLDELRSLVDPFDVGNQCVWQSVMNLDVLLQRWSDRGYAAPYQWLVTDAVRMRGDEEVRERVVMLI